jgi:predicted nucleic acid-binding protein
MTADRFLDTNVLVYAFSADSRRGPTAKNLLVEGGVIGMQVLNEFTNVAQRKLGWDWPQILDALTIVADLLEAPREMTRAIHTRALELARTHRLAFYDALTVAAAAEAGCTTLLTEDLQHGRKIGEVTIRNPFLKAA